MSQTSLQTEEVFTVKEHKYTHTHKHTQTQTHTHTQTQKLNLMFSSYYGSEKI